MKIQYASFMLPLYSGSDEQEDLNRFLRSHRIVQTQKEIVVTKDMSHWAILVEYIDSAEKSTNEAVKGKVDYKEILNTVDFGLYSKLREVRKKLAEGNGLPVYAVCTNEQLAELAKRRPKSLNECMQIGGIGQGKIEKYIPALLECIKNESSETSENNSALF